MKFSYLRKRHSVSLLTYHLILIVKFRKKIFNNEILNVIKSESNNILIEIDGSLIEFNGEEDHIHLLIQLPPNINISSFIGRLKQRLSSLIFKQFPEIKRHLWKNELRTSSYFIVSTGGVTIEKLKEYIKNQSRPN